MSTDQVTMRGLVAAMRKFVVPLVAALIVLAPMVLVTSVEAGGRPLSATLTGAAEVPGPGDPDGSGNSTVTLNMGAGEICFSITVSNITLPASAAHIHAAPAGVAGPVVVTLAPPGANGSSSGCVSASEALIKAIRKNPSAYYVNVHTSDFPAGAVRGQLAK